MIYETDSIKLSDWASIIIAALAFGATWWQAKITRKHNQISVTPMLTSSEQWNSKPSELTFSFVIKNVGIGVALVNDRYFTFEGNKFIPKNPHLLIEEILTLTFETLPQHQIVATGIFGKNAKIPPGSEIIIAKMIFENTDSDLKNIINKLATKINFHINYQSLYGEKFTFSTND